MNSSLLDLLRRNGLFRSVLAVAATLILGALGSGLWELLLKDLFVGLGNITLSLIGWLWSGYIDVLHKNIGEMDGDLLALPVFAFTIVTVVGMPWFLIWKLMHMVAKIESRIQNKDIDHSDDDFPVSEHLLRIRKKIFRLLFPLAALTTALFLILNWQLLYTRDAGSWTLRSIEIIAPSFCVPLGAMGDRQSTAYNLMILFILVPFCKIISSLSIMFLLLLMCDDNRCISNSCDSAWQRVNASGWSGSHFSGSYA